MGQQQWVQPGPPPAKYWHQQQYAGSGSGGPGGQAHGFCWGCPDLASGAAQIISAASWSVIHSRDDGGLSTANSCWLPSIFALRQLGIAWLPVALHCRLHAGVLQDLLLPLPAHRPRCVNSQSPYSAPYLPHQKWHEEGIRSDGQNGCRASICCLKQAVHRSS